MPSNVETALIQDCERPRDAAMRRVPSSSNRNAATRSAENRTLRVVDQPLEDLVEVEAAADVARDPPERVGALELVGDVARPTSRRG